MAITMKGKTEYVGQVLKTYDHYWMDGMLEEYAVVWDMENHETKTLTVGYYGSDGCNLCGHVEVDVDYTEDVARDILRTIKHKSAVEMYVRSVIANKEQIRAGMTCEVVKGRKVKKGTILDVFWVGERPTYQSMQYGWLDETETIAGCHDENGNKVWIKAEYLKSLTPIKSPCAAERSKFIKAYVRESAKALGVMYP